MSHATRKEYLPHERITYQDLIYLMNAKESTAQRYISDIRKHYKINLVTYWHYLNYFKIGYN